MAAEEVTEATLPFGMGSVDLTDPGAVLTIVVSLIAGFTLWNMTSSIGSNFAARVNSAIGSFAGYNPATGEGDDGVPEV